MVKDLSLDDISRFAFQHAPHDGLALPGMVYVLQNLYEAHKAAPGGVTMEIGSYQGRTTKAILDFLNLIYSDRAPLVITVDPYGSKFYNSGDSKGDLNYGDNLYLDLKKNTLTYSNHAHFKVTSFEALAILPGLHYYREGISNRMDSFSFVFLDGEHDLDTVMKEHNVLTNFLLTGGRMVVDNVDKDARLIPALERIGYTIGPKQPMHGARQAVYHGR